MSVRLIRPANIEARIFEEKEGQRLRAANKWIRQGFPRKAFKGDKFKLKDRNILCFYNDIFQYVVEFDMKVATTPNYQSWVEKKRAQGYLMLTVGVFRQRKYGNVVAQVVHHRRRINAESKAKGV